jgi:hypothetical protein
MPATVTTVSADFRELANPDGSEAGVLWRESQPMPARSRSSAGELTITRACLLKTTSRELPWTRLASSGSTFAIIALSAVVAPQRFEFLMSQASVNGQPRPPLPPHLRHFKPFAILLLVGAVVAAVGRGQGTSPEGNQPVDDVRVARAGPRRFFDGLLGRGNATAEPSPAARSRQRFIPAPQPDPAPVKEEDPMLEEPPASLAENETDLAVESESGDDVRAGDAETGANLAWPQTAWDEVKALAGKMADSAKTVMGQEPQDQDDRNGPAGVGAALDEESPQEATTESTSPPTIPTHALATDRQETSDASQEKAAAVRPRRPLSPPSAAAPPQTREFAILKKQVERTLDTYKRRPLNTVDNTPWEVMHGFIAFGIPSQVRVGNSGTLVNAIGWMNMGGRCRGQVMMVPAGDLPTCLIGYGVQGHLAQYLAILAQCRVAQESPIRLQGHEYTVADLVEQEKLCCRSGVELTFTLIGLSHYLPADEVWKSREGETWSLERLVEEELAQPVRTAPCGGTHRLFGLSYACQRRREATGTLDGAFKRADKFVREYQVFALSQLQNPDGSFSTEWFKYPADRTDDIDRKVQTTGHILEWLVASADQPLLYHPRVVLATSFLARALASEPDREWKIGPLGHALHALTVYQERAWGTVHPGSIAAFHGPMKAVPNRPAALAAGIDLEEPVLIR